MKTTIKMKIVRPLMLWLIRLAGSDIPDARTGKVIGRALLLPWRGRIFVLGIEPCLVPVFYPQARMVQWKTVLGFTRHPVPDFPHEPRS